MKNILFATAALGLVSFLACESHAQQPSVAAACGTQTMPVGYATGNLIVTTAGQLCANATLTPGGTQDVNLAQVAGTTTTVGAGAGAAGTQRVTTSTDSTIGTVTSVTTVATVTNPVGVKGADGSAITSVTNALPVQATPSATAANANTAVVSSSLEACHVIKASAGNLYSVGATIQATTGIIQVFNATSAPVDGAVTPVWSMPIVSNGTLGGASFEWSIPLRLGTGITICFSSATTPFTKTASATALISANAQ